MSHIMDDEIDALGATSVIVVLKQSSPKKSKALAAAAAKTTIDPNELKKHFTRQANTQRSQVALAMRASASTKTSARYGTVETFSVPPAG